MNQKINIRSLSLEELGAYIKKTGEKNFRAKQIYEWLWKKSARSIEEMTNLSKELRDQLNNDFVLNAVQVDQTQTSTDRTIKTRFKLFDNHKIEGVLIPTTDRMTACISSQVGCSLTCKFCATGFIDRKRNLEPDEIYDQVAIIKKQAEENYKKNLTNIVFMGMGEPLLNYNNVVKGIERITSEDGLAISPRRITLSTVGIAKMIKKLADDEVKFRLALSLHAADDEKRSSIMPINDQNSLSALSEALQYYYAKTKNRLTFEYILLKDFNDSIEDAKKLVAFCRRIPSKVNIIEYNPIDQADFKKADTETLNRFNQYLVNQGVFVSVRRSRGKDIDAACGQLANKG